MTAAAESHAEEARPDSGALARYSWALADCARDPFFTLVMVYYFPPYFVNHVVGEPIRGQEIWGYTVGGSAAILAVLSPILGSIGDYTGRRKPWALLLAMLGSAATLALWFALPGAASGLWLPIVAFAVASVAIELSLIFTNAMLPTLVSHERIGRLSGLGAGLAFVASVLVMGAMYLVGSLADSGAIRLDAESYELDRISNVVCGAWLAVFMVPFFAFTKEPAASGLRLGEAVTRGVRTLVATFLHLRRYRDLALFMLARAAYVDGMMGLLSFTAVLGSSMFGWGFKEMTIYGIGTVVAAALFSFAGGALEDRFGSRWSVLISLGGLVATSLLMSSVGPAEIFFVEVISPEEATHPDTPLFGTPPQLVYVVSGVVQGGFVGSITAASRSLLARMAPIEMMTEFFGLFQMIGRATTFLAPISIGAVTALAQSQRFALYSVSIVFLGAGFGIMLLVREARPPTSHQAELAR